MTPTLCLFFNWEVLCYASNPCHNLMFQFWNIFCKIIIVSTYISIPSLRQMRAISSGVPWSWVKCRHLWINVLIFVFYQKDRWCYSDTFVRYKMRCPVKSESWVRCQLERCRKNKLLTCWGQNEKKPTQYIDVRT